MKKSPKQIGAIIALVLILAIIICFVISAVTTTSGSNFFFICFFIIIAAPILAWLFILCYGRLKGKHTMAELFPKDWAGNDGQLKQNPDNENFTEEEITEAMEASKKEN